MDTEERTSVPPSLPPFRPDSVDRPPWLKGAAIGCGALSVLLVIGGIFLAGKFDGLMGAFLVGVQAQVEAKLPSDLAPAQADRLATAFAEARAQADSGGYLDPEALEAINRSVLELEAEPRVETVLQLIEALESLAAAGEESEPEADSGAPEAPPSSANAEADLV